MSLSLFLSPFLSLCGIGVGPLHLPDKLTNTEQHPAPSEVQSGANEDVIMEAIKPCTQRTGSVPSTNRC